MKRPKSWILAAGVAAALSLAAAVGAQVLPSVSPVPSTLTHQGRLLDAAGAPLAGTASLRFALYASASGGDALWSETQSVALEDGHYSARLGSVTAFPADAFDGSARYLGVTVGDDVELTPRQSVGSVPYALVAGNVTGDISPRSVTVGGVPVIASDGRWVGPSSGLAGPQGEQGVAGAAGPQGIPGPQGVAGAQGEPGVAGAVGAQGPQGIPGPQGSAGSQGEPGPQGATGPQGIPGPQGVAGAQGEPGVAGAVGPQGVAGAQGPVGPMGPAGTGPSLYGADGVRVGQFLSGVFPTFPTGADLLIDGAIVHYSFSYGVGSPELYLTSGETQNVRFTHRDCLASSAVLLRTGQPEMNLTADVPTISGVSTEQVTLDLSSGAPVSTVRNVFYLNASLRRCTSSRTNGDPLLVWNARLVTSPRTIAFPITIR